MPVFLLLNLLSSGFSIYRCRKADFRHGQQVDQFFVFECQFWKTAPLSFRLRSFSQNFLIRVFKSKKKCFSFALRHTLVVLEMH